jgi:hypothetical protein
MYRSARLGFGYTLANIWVPSLYIGANVQVGNLKSVEALR